MIINEIDLEETVKLSRPSDEEGRDKKYMPGWTCGRIKNKRTTETKVYGWHLLELWKSGCQLCSCFI